MDIPHSLLPHGNEYVAVTGNTSNPQKALILLHGRGSSADNVMHLIDELSITNDYIVLAPQATEHQWYPERFTVPQSDNQPHLDSALDRIHSIVHFLETTYSIKTENVVLAGFSQGACLISEYLKQHPTKYKGAAVLSGGLIGTDTEVAQPGQPGLNQTPMYIGCDVADFHIPKERIVVTAETFTKMAANVDLQLFEGLGHTIHPKGLSALQHFINL